MRDAPYHRRMNWAELHEFAGVSAPLFSPCTYRAFRYDREVRRFLHAPAFSRAGVGCGQYPT
jgi:hypothetical protein